MIRGIDKGGRYTHPVSHGTGDIFRDYIIFCFLSPPLKSAFVNSGMFVNYLSSNFREEPGSSIAFYADNTNVAFNEYLQIWFEQGLLRFAQPFFAPVKCRCSLSVSSNVVRASICRLTALPLTLKDTPADSTALTIGAAGPASNSVTLVIASAVTATAAGQGPKQLSAAGLQPCHKGFSGHR